MSESKIKTRRPHLSDSQEPLRALANGVSNGLHGANCVVTPFEAPNTVIGTRITEAKGNRSEVEPFGGIMLCPA